jgi:hypothetical protein
MQHSTKLRGKNTFISSLTASVVSGEEMLRRKFSRKIAVVIMIAAVIIAISLIHYLFAPRDISYSKRIYPGQTYLAWDGNPSPSGYTFHAINYHLYVNGSVVFGSGTDQTSWTCPEYVYGQEGDPKFKVDYAIAWTESYIATPPS